MLLIPGGWELATLLAKFIFYLGAASLVGASISTQLYSDGSRRQLQFSLIYMLAGCLAGFHAVGLSYLFQIGLINGSGLGGMFDMSMIRLLLDTDLGDATFLRLSGFLLAGLGNIFFLYRVSRLRRPPGMLFYRQVIIINMLGFLLISLAQGRVGHVSVLELPARIAVVIHLLCVSYWLGALLPLRHLCTGSDPAALRQTMQRFGEHAQWMVAILVATGIFVLWQLLASPAELLTTAYGRSLLVKLLLVVGIVAIAARNRFQLMPALTNPEGCRRMAKSIDAEMLVAAAILLLTAYLSTVIGPAES